jgi:hypothetical protein
MLQRFLRTCNSIAQACMDFSVAHAIAPQITNTVFFGLFSVAGHGGGAAE